ncbi:MAG: hypothetical protein AAGB46_06795, partial [Verrucomicrobiota bacterium]
MKRFLSEAVSVVYSLEFIHSALETNRPETSSWSSMATFSASDSAWRAIARRHFADLPPPDDKRPFKGTSSVP